jgi:hypothetical protein
MRWQPMAVCPLSMSEDPFGSIPRNWPIGYARENLKLTESDFSYHTISAIMPNQTPARKIVRRHIAFAGTESIHVEEAVPFRATLPISPHNHFLVYAS